MLLSYAVGALLLSALSLRPAPPIQLAYLGHGFDIVVSTTLMYYCEGGSISFFALLVFTLLSSAAQWDWKSTLGTAILLLLVLGGLMLLTHGAGEARARDLNEDLLREGLRAGFLLTCGAIMAYFAGLRERSRSRFQQIAEVSTRHAHAVSPSRDCLRDMISRVADILEADYVLLRFQAKPDMQWSTLECSNGVVRSISPLVAETGVCKLDDERVGPSEELHTEKDGGLTLVGRKSREHVKVAPQLISATFKFENCCGWITARNRRAWSREDHTILQILAAQIGAEVEEQGLRTALQAAAAREERLRLARDLHDGPLQGIAAANLQLGLVSQHVPKHVQAQLRATRSLLSGEANRIRSTVRNSPAPRASMKRPVRLLRALDDRVNRLSRQWGCTIILDIRPVSLRVSPDDAIHVANMVSEAVSNAVRHGHATEVDISMQRCGDRLILDVQDNGGGCFAEEGTYSHSALATANLGPRMLRSRVETLGGSISLTSSRHGTALHIEFST
ncbi:sensor histidine kinase [Methylobacterium oxalidis]|uniref:sensor histidine kinase n=1 Tax=Methylobacterium oxalidis TaxID=944322 RepID=UPI003315482B